MKRKRRGIKEEGKGKKNEWEKGDKRKKERRGKKKGRRGKKKWKDGKACKGKEVPKLLTDCTVASGLRVDFHVPS